MKKKMTWIRLRKKNVHEEWKIGVKGNKKIHNQKKE